MGVIIVSVFHPGTHGPACSDLIAKCSYAFLVLNSPIFHYN